MNVTVIACGLLLVVGCLLGLVAYEVLVRISQPEGRVIVAGTQGEKRTSKRESTEKKGSRLRASGMLALLSDALERFAPFARPDFDACRERLARAGVSLSPATWRSLRVLFAALGAFLVGGICALITSFPLAISAVLLCLGGIVGWMAPLLVLASREKERRRAIDVHLPDAMELLGIAIAAGSPVEQCFKEVSQSVEGPLSEELSLVDQEVNLLGHARETALENMADRCRSQNVSAFVTQLTQAITQGSSIAEGLTTQATLAREAAQVAMLERIRKMPTKLDIVLSLCFLPPTVVVVIVPTVVNLLAFLNDSMM